MRDGSTQARFIIEEIRRLVRRDYSVAVLCIISISFSCNGASDGVSARASAYVVTSGVRFFEQAHIKDGCSLLRLIANPSDALAFSRLMELFQK